ncbi:hypothetical protein [Adhaeribacter radiodurans]|uniref:T9SS C-terminal target domain-containing protein n=1 Tax=Adhaeribacter radiodurans TaxID=2745197 RepID=A0A7L7L7G3_9BACT|nr:hypothetical protein [Adhaeribacter radiodurans]QMU28782.1 hypothetical protein HUW48_12375 [Adhaeribacter radiodurans]
MKTTLFFFLQIRLLFSLKPDKYRVALLLLIELFISFASLAQTKVWDKTLGGNGTDELKIVQQTSDGGYILGGSSNSQPGIDKSQANKGNFDYWVLKLNADGSKAWDKTFGGSKSDYLFSLQQTKDGGYILGGNSESGKGGDKSQDAKGYSDYWVVKLDANGSKAWDKTFGGTDSDELTSVQETIDGGYILGGSSSSNKNSDKTQASKGSYDYWIIKLQADGTKVWDKILGGNDSDYLSSVQQTGNGGYILGGHSRSGISGDKSEASKDSSSDDDYWIVKLTPNGTKTWDKTLGGNSRDDLHALQLTKDGGYIVGGYSFSGISGDKTEASKGGNADYWVVKIGANGTKEWDKTIG